MNEVYKLAAVCHPVSRSTLLVPGIIAGLLALVSCNSTMVIPPTTTASSEPVFSAQQVATMPAELPLTKEPEAHPESSEPKALPAIFAASLHRMSRPPVFVDVREESACTADRIPGALCIPAEDLEARLVELPRDQEFVVYGAGRGKADAKAIASAELIASKGFLTVYVLEGGPDDYLIALEQLDSVSSGGCGCGR